MLFNTNLSRPSDVSDNVIESFAVAERWHSGVFDEVILEYQAKEIFGNGSCPSIGFQPGKMRDWVQGGTTRAGKEAGRCLEWWRDKFWETCSDAVGLPMETQKVWGDTFNLHLLCSMLIKYIPSRAARCCYLCRKSPTVSESRAFGCICLPSSTKETLGPSWPNWYWGVPLPCKLAVSMEVTTKRGKVN